MFEVFGITRSLSKEGCPYDNAVVESTDKTLKAEFVYGERFDSLEELQIVNRVSLQMILTHSTRCGPPIGPTFSYTQE